MSGIKIYRKRKKKKSLGKMKLVRINDKTEIEVSIDIPDEVAREKYLERLADSQPIKQPGYSSKRKK